eukprot:s246_g9.t1
MLAEEVATSLPAAKLAAVTRNPSTGVIYGVVYRQGLTDEGSVQIKAWLLRLSETEQGSFYWDDFVPVCGSCKEMLSPLEGKQRCPVCQGRKGAGKCFQFDCRSTPLRHGCGKLPVARPTYCGSHPLFGGYRLPDAVVGDVGPGLWEEEIESCTLDTFNMSMAATDRWNEVFVFPGYRDDQDSQHTRRIVLNEDGPAIISCEKKEGSGPYVSAVVLTEFPHHFSLVQQLYGDMSVWRWVRTGNGVDSDSAVVDCPAECKQFGKQIVRLGNGLVALSKRSLWAMDLAVLKGSFWKRLPPTTTAADVANKVAWRKLMDLPQRQEDQEESEEERDADGYDTDEEQELDDLPGRLLAPGPKENQVIIFKTEGFQTTPWLLVDMPGHPQGAETHVTKITSTASVLWKRKEELFERGRGLTTKLCSLLPSVFRMNQRHGGYLFFDERGRIFRVRDEEIILQQDAAWQFYLVSAGYIFVM